MLQFIWQTTYYLQSKAEHEQLHVFKLPFEHTNEHTNMQL